MDESCDGRDEYGRVEIERYLTHLREDPDCNCDWTFPVVSYFVQTERDYLSPTTLQRCPREIFLGHATDYAVDLAKAWPRARGTISHTGLEKYPEGQTEVALERAIEVEGRAYLIQGRADNLILDRGLIRDWKTTGSISRLMKMGDLPKAEHVEQLSVYGWMAGDAYTRGEVIYIDAYGMKRVQFDLWDHETVERMIRARLPVRAQMMEMGMQVRAWREGGKEGGKITVTGVAPVLPGCTGDHEPGQCPSEQWKCDYCDVRDQCEALAFREGNKPPMGRGCLVSQASKPASRSRKAASKTVDSDSRS